MRRVPMPTGSHLLDRPRTALERATAALAAFRAVGRFGPFDVYEDAWATFLDKLEKVWAKTASACARHPSWPVLETRYEGFREKDPLLRYMTEARHTDQHTVREVIEDQPIRINDPEFAPGNPLHGTPVPKTEDGTSIVSGIITLSWTEPKRVLLPVANRRDRFDPPVEHNGAPLPAYDPVTVAETALRFYARMIDDVERTLNPQL
jgi:hypothetical protein